MNVFITWLWGSAYSMADVYKLYAGVRRNVRGSFRFMLMTERERRLDRLPPGVERHAIKDPELLAHRGCLVRLRMFDLGWQQNRDLEPDDRLICLDLDNVITGELDPLLERDDELVILAGGNAVNPCPYVGAMMMIRPGTNRHVWETFSLEAIRAAPYHEFPDDQGWLWHTVPKAGTWPVGASSGAYVFCKRGWPGWPSKFSSHALPPGARVVAFTGWRKPAKFADVRWIKDHWRYP